MLMMDKMDGVDLCRLIDRLHTHEGKEIVIAWYTGTSNYLKLDVPHLMVEALWYATDGDEWVERKNKKAAYSEYIEAFKHFEMAGMFSEAYELAKRIKYKKEKEIYKHFVDILIPYGR